MNSIFDHLLNHRSIRKFESKQIEKTLLNEILQCGLQASSSGNMQSWSVVVSSDSIQKQKLYELHMEQSMILQAPVVLTFCADFHRMRRWLKLRNAKDGFNDLSGYLVGAFDAVIAAQNISIAAEAAGLGICYMGTTLWCAKDLINLLKLPKGVIPVTSIVMGYPQEAPNTRDRLPLESMVHQETYNSVSDQEILSYYKNREELGWKRYELNFGKEFMEELKQQGIENLAQFYTSDRKYSKEYFAKFATEYLECLKSQDFWEF